MALIKVWIISKDGVGKARLTGIEIFKELINLRPLKYLDIIFFGNEVILKDLSGGNIFSVNLEIVLLLIFIHFGFYR